MHWVKVLPGSFSAVRRSAQVLRFLRQTVGRTLSDTNRQGAANGGDGRAGTGAACTPLRLMPLWPGTLARTAAGLRRPAEDSSVSGGQSNPTYHLRTCRWRLRTSQEAARQSCCPEPIEVEREHRVMAALADTDVPVPRTRLLCQDETVLGTSFFVMDHVAGRVFPRPGHARGDTGAPCSRSTRIWRRVLAALHSRGLGARART